METNESPAADELRVPETLRGARPDADVPGETRTSSPLASFLSSIWISAAAQTGYLESAWFDSVLPPGKVN